MDIQAIDKLFACCSEDDKPIDLPKTYLTELLILTNGGVTARDFRKAVDIWIEFKTPVNNSYGFIRNMAIKIAAERIEDKLVEDS